MSLEVAAEPPVAEAPPPGEPITSEMTPEELEQKLKLQIVDVSHGVAANAIDSADEYINEKTRGKDIVGFAKKIWFGNLARDPIRAHKVQRNREEIIASGNLYALTDASQTEHDQATQAVVERFTSEYDLLHKNEINKSFEDAENGTALESQVKDLVKEYADGKIGIDALVEEKTRILSEYGNHVRDGDRNKGLLYADNIIEVAQNAKLAAEHGLGIDRIDAALQGHIGEARVGVRTDAKYEKVDKIVDKLYQSRIRGAFVNEAVLIGATSVAMNLAKVTTRKATTALGATLGLGVGAGVIAGVREHYHVGQERQLHMRQMAEGGQMVENSKRREKLENTRYESASAQELIDRLASSSDAANLVGETDPSKLNDLIFNISRTQTLVGMSDDRSIDLITFSSKTAVESERLVLDIELAKAKIALQKILDTTPSEQLNTAGIGSTDSESLISQQINRIDAALNEDISDKDRVFKKLRRNRTLGMAALGAATGVGVGLALQEGKSLIDSGLNGLLTDPKHPERDTLLDGIIDKGHHLDQFSEKNIHHGGLSLPDGYHQVGHSIVDPDGKTVVDGLEWGHHGKLTEDSIAALHDKGFGTEDKVINYTHHGVADSKIHHNAHEFFRHGHHKGFERVHRELWYDNNTPAPNFDQNELRMDWGAGGTGITENGNYVFNVAGMTQDGSSHNGLSANAQELARQHKLVVALSMTKGSQNFVELIHIDEHGNAIIDKDSVAGQSMFTHEGGHAKFVGAYAETAQVLSQSKEHGVHTRMLATVVGENHPHGWTETVHHAATEHRSYHITEINVERPVEIPPVVPVYARRGLERLEENSSGIPYYGSYESGGYYGSLAEQGRTPEEIRRNSAPFAPELIDDPDAKIDANTVTKRYFDSLPQAKKNNTEKQVRALERQPKNDKPKVVVMIPAAAHQEGGNIYRTLMQYAGQEAEKNDFEVVVFTNNPKTANRDNTISEIERFQKDHPEVKVRLMEQKLERDEANIGWVRKTLTDTVLMDLVNRGVDLNEVLLVSNDADSYWINPKYISTIIKKAEAQPEADGFLGFLDWSYDAYKSHPEILIGTRLMQMMEIRARTKYSEVGSSGANFVFRPRVYAAAGGYRSTSLGEDTQLGAMIRGMRSGSEQRPIMFLGRSTEVNTSGRRALENLLKHGGAPIKQWSLPFGPEDELRNKDFGLRDFNYDDPSAVQRLINSSEHIINDTLSPWVKSATEREYTSNYHTTRLNLLDPEMIRSINFMLGVIGVKVRWQPDGTIRITGSTRMIANLRRWQSEH
jgi:hypothetical protein